MPGYSSFVRAAAAAGGDVGATVNQSVAAVAANGDVGGTVNHSVAAVAANGDEGAPVNHSVAAVAPAVVRVAWLKAATARSAATFALRWASSCAKVSRLSFIASCRSVSSS
jgi:hypothetical protein